MLILLPWTNPLDGAGGAIGSPPIGPGAGIGVLIEGAIPGPAGGGGESIGLMVGVIGLMDGVIGLIGGGDMVDGGGGGGDMADGGGDMVDIGGGVVVEVVGGIDMVDGGIDGAIMGDWAAERAINVRKREKIIIGCKRAMIIDDSLRMFCLGMREFLKRVHTQRLSFEEVCIL